MAIKKLKRKLGSVLLVGLGILSIGLGIKGFLMPSGFIDGGVTGISMLLSDLLNQPLALLLPIINLPFIWLGYQHLGKGFALKSAMAIAGLALCLALIQFPVITSDKLLTSVFGGFFIGTGIGLAIRSGTVLDGTEIAALIISRVSHIFSVGDVILILNIVIFSAAAFFLGVEPALYSILTYLSASKTVDFLIHGIEEYTAIIIMSDQSEAIRQQIIMELNRGVTVYKGQGGLTGAEQNILYCVVTRLEIGDVKTVVREIDESAFILVHHLPMSKGVSLKDLPYRLKPTGKEIDS